MPTLIPHRSTVNDTLGRLAPELPLRLISEKARAAIGHVTRQLPAALTGWHHLECRLDDSDAVDLIVQVEARGPMALLSQLNAASPRGGVWHDVGRLARACCDDGLLAAVLPRLWLEFDLPTTAEPSADPPVPSVFAELTPEGVRGAMPAMREEAAARAMAVLRAAPVAVDAFSRSIRALPPSATVFAIGVMSSRSEPTLRICVTGLEKHDVVPWLEAVAWPGDTTHLLAVHQAVWATLPEYVVRHGILHVDINDGVLTPRLGFEYMLNRRSQAHGRLVESQFLELLTHNGWAQREKIDGLAAWPGVHRVRLPHLLWPSLAVRRVNHIKIVTDGAAGVIAKAYLVAGERYAMPADASTRPQQSADSIQ